MYSTIRALVVASALATPILICRLSLGEWTSQVQKVPRDANALVLYDVDKILASPVAQREGWEAKREKMYAAGLSSIPPRTSQLVIASQLDLEFNEPIWETAIIRFAVPPSLSTVARVFGGETDEIAGVPGVAMPDDSYIVSFDANTLGAMSPGNRQQVGRWVRGDNDGTLSPYLAEALKFAEGGTPLIMALDLENSLTPDVILQRLKNSPFSALQGKNVDLEKLSGALASIRGVTLGVTFGERPYGAIKADFSQDVSMMSTYAQALMLEVLERRGAMLDELATWKSKVDSNRITIEGPLTADGLRRITSLLSLPTPSVHAATSTSSAEASAEEAARQKAYATQTYFRSVNDMLDDLRGQKGEARTIGQIGVWFENYARKIDRLPMVGVDPDMINYGGYVASTLRDASMAVKGIGINTNVRKVTAINSGVTNEYGGGYRYGRYGAYGYGTYTRGMTLQEQAATRTTIASQEKARGAVSVNTLMQEIQEATGQVRRDMTQRYMIEF